LKGSGKTFIGILKLLYLLEQYPGSRGVIIRQRFAQLKKTTAATLRQLLPRQQIARRNDNEGYIQLKNGSELLLMHLDKPDSIDNLKSLELNFAYIDQMEDIREEAWDTLLERLGRWTGASMKGGYPADWPFKTAVGDPIPPAYAFVSAYSPGYDHWITRRWWEKGADRDKYRKQGYIVVIGSTRENPNLTKTYVDGRLAMGDEYVERFVDALSWGANEGRIFQVDDQSYIQPTSELLSKIKGEMHLHRVLDPGDFTTTACLWYATDRDGNVFFYREYGKENELVSAHRRNIFELSKLDSFNGKDLPMYHSNIADPIISNKTRGRSLDKAPQWSVQDEYCLAPETKVLTSDLHHVPVGTLVEGDVLAGFDEFPESKEGRKHRSWKTSIVEKASRKVLPSYRLTFSDGTTVTASSGHKWLANPTGQWRKWITTESLAIGHKVFRVVDVWETDTSNGGGYLAAAIDGEGFLTQGKGTFRTGFSQRDNGMLARVKKELSTRNIKYSISQSKFCDVFNITIGFRAHVLRLLGSVRPERLVLTIDWNKLGRIHAIDKPQLIKKEYLGETEVVALRTSTHTVIAEGLMSHNTDRAIMEPETAVYWRKANNDESMTISRVREYLRVDPHHRNPITGLMGAPRIYFVLRTPSYPHGLHETITDMIAAKREECGENADGTKQFRDKRDEDVRDHYLDCVRYAIGMRPKLAPPKAGAATPDGAIRLDEYYKLSEDHRDFLKRQERADFKGHSDWGQ
jgi:hypothetical protein